MTYVTYRIISQILKEYHDRTGLFMYLPDAVLCAQEQHLTTNTKHHISRRFALSKAEFLNIIEQTPIDVDFILNRNQYTDSKLIPDDLSVFVLRHLTYKEQSIHPHNCFDVIYLYEGEATLIFEDETRILKQGEICITGPHSKYKILSDDDIHNTIIVMYIRKSNFEQMFFDTFTEYDLLSLFFRNILYNKESSSNYIMFYAKHIDDIKEIIQNVYVEANYPDQYSPSTTIQFMHLLFTTILRDFDFSHTYTTLDNKKRAYFFKIIDYVQGHFQTVTIKELSQKFHYNESYLSELFVKYLGINFTTVLTHLKISHAKSLLAQTKFSINEISEIVGYGSVDHFSRTFKKITNLSPSIYRQLQQDKKING